MSFLAWAAAAAGMETALPALVFWPLFLVFQLLLWITIAKRVVAWVICLFYDPHPERKQEAPPEADRTPPNFWTGKQAQGDNFQAYEQKLAKWVEARSKL